MMMTRAKDIIDQPKATDDQQLLTLGTLAATFEAQFDQFENDPRDAHNVPGYSEALDAHGHTLQAIANIEATTLAGMRVKAERIAHFRLGISDDMAMSDADLALALSIVRDLIRSGA